MNPVGFSRKSLIYKMLENLQKFSKNVQSHPVYGILIKMQELDLALQTAVKVRTELWSMVTNLLKEPYTNIGIPLTFHENGQIIAWENNCERFTPATFRFVQQLWIASGYTLSREDVRQYVIENKEASNEAVWQCLKRARQELKSVGFPYEIETLRGKGYLLIRCQEPDEFMSGSKAIDR